MYYVIFGTDKPGMSNVRQDIRPVHREYLRNPGAHKVKVHIGGPTLTHDLETMNGTLLVVEAQSMEAVQNFVKDDPYSAADIFAEIVIRPWVWGLGGPVDTK